MIDIPVQIQNATQEDALKILSNLRAGRSLGVSDKFGVVKPIFISAQVHINHLVMLSRTEGCKSSVSSTWIVAPWGGGKTEALSAIEKDLISERHQNGLGKSLVIPLNLLEDLEDGSAASSLQQAIFWKATLTSTSGIKKEIDGLVDFLIARSPSEQIGRQVIGMGINIIFSMLNISIPGAKPGINWLVTEIIQRIKLSERSIRKVLKKQGITSEDAVHLCTVWVKYCLDPNKEKRLALESKVTSLSQKKHLLFAVFCQLLQLSGYTTLVFLIDEADEVQWAGLTPAFQLLWESPDGAENIHDDLDKFFVFACTPKTKEDLGNESKFGGFTRRLIGPPTSPYPEFKLKTPVITSRKNSGDDFDYAVNSIKTLVQRLGIEVVYKPSEEEHLRNILLKESKQNNLTWHGLWAAVCDIYYRKA